MARFLHISTFFPPYAFGGEAVFMRRLCDHLHQEGHDVEVIHCVDSFRVFESTPVSNITYPYRVHRIESGWGPLSPVHSYLTGRAGPWKSRVLREAIERFSPDVIHFHSPSLLGAPEILAWGNAIKLYTLHDHWLVCPTHVLFQNRERPCEAPLTCARCLLAHRRPPPIWRADSRWKQQLRHIHRFLAPSRFTMERHLADNLPMRIEHFPLFVPPPSHAPTGDAQSHFLMAGRLEELKGFLGIAQLWPSSAPPLHIAGHGNQRAQIEAIAQRKPNVRVLPWLDDHALAAQYAGAIAVLAPSRTHETFGLTAVEAAAHGKPIVARSVGGLRELIADHQIGLITETDQDLISAALGLARSPELANFLGRNGTRTFLRQWTWEAFRERYFQLIDALQIEHQGSSRFSLRADKTVKE